MKKLISVFLALILILSCLPLSAAAKEATVEQKFKLLLEDMEITYRYHQPARYYYAELQKGDRWVLIRAGMTDQNPQDGDSPKHYAVVGNKLIAAHASSEPFKSGYGVYDTHSGAFYDLTDAWDRDFSGLRDAWNAMNADTKIAYECSAAIIGDADQDGELTILDATRIQRYLAELNQNPFSMVKASDYYYGYPIGCTIDFDRDGSFTIMDATKIQRNLADLPNNLETKLAFDLRTVHGDDVGKNIARVITSAKELDSFFRTYGENPNNGGEFVSRDDIAGYDDAYFESKMLIGCYVYLTSGSYHLRYQGAKITADGTLDVSFKRNDPNIVTDDSNERFVLIEASAAFADDIRRVTLSVTADSALSIVDTFEYGKGITRPADPAKEGYREVASTSVFWANMMDPGDNPPLDWRAYDYIMTNVGGIADAEENRYERGFIAVIENMTQLTYLFPKADTAKYNDKFFQTNVLVAGVAYLNASVTRLELSHLAVKDGVLYAQADAISQYPSEPVPASNRYYNVYAVKKSALASATHTAIWVSGQSESSVIAQIPFYDRISATAPSDLNSGGYQEVAGEKLTISAPYKYDYGFGGALKDIDTGYVLLLRDREDFEHYLPEFDTEKNLDDAFFKDYAVLAMLQHGGADEAYATLSDVAVSQDGTLWCSPQIDYHYLYIDGVAVTSPTDPVVWTFLKVRQSDVKSVNALNFWKAHVYDPDKDYEYTVNDDGDVEITKYIGDKTIVSVPSSIGGKKVAAVGDKAFRLSKVERVALPDTVTKIGEKAFASCTYLTSITIPDSVTSIGSQAFYYCSSLADLTMSKNVTFIGSYAFYACNSIESFTIPSGVTRINNDTFGYCTGLKSLTMSDNVTYIGEQAFYRCNALPSIRLSSNVQTIDISAFEKCISLKSLSIPRTCKTFRAKAMMDCRSLESVYFANETPAGFELLPIENYTIGSSAFEGCTALTDVSMPDTIKTIGSRAFFGCSSLGEFDLPGSVTEIGADTFNGCESLTAVRQNKSGDLTVKTVGDYAFRSCTALRDIRFTDSLTDIGDAAFRGCSSLSSLDLKENLKTIGTDAFLECTALKKLTVPQSVTSISSGALGYTVDDTNHYVKRTDFTIRGYLNSKAHTYATQYSIPFEAIDEEDGIFSTLITDDKKVAEGVYGEAVEYENLPTRDICFELDYNKYGNDLSVFTGQPFRVAIIRSYDEYQRFFSTAYFEEYDTAYEPKGAVYMSVDANDEGQPLPEEFFTDNALIVGVGTFSLGSGRLTFDEIRRMENGELVIRFNSLTADDLNHGAPYAAPILGYEFAAAQVSQEVVRNVQSVKMLPQVKRLSDAGILTFNVIDAYYPQGDLKLGQDHTAVYITSADEIDGAIDTLYTDLLTGTSHRDKDDHVFSAQSLDERWFETHDLIGVRVYKDRGLSARVNEVYVESGKMTVVVNTDYIPSYSGVEESNESKSRWAFFFIGIDKRATPEDVLAVLVGETVVAKPIIYLYPEEETELTVTLGKSEELTCTYPAYNTGWHVTAKPDGTLIDDAGRSYYSLYWESKSKTTVTMPDGFVVKGEDTAKFFEEKLAALGLTEREAEEFIVYWLPLMQDNEYNLIRFATAEEIEEIMPLSFSVQPDTVIRVLMEYTPLDEYIEVTEQELTPAPERKGFTAVEWGGTRIG